MATIQLRFVQEVRESGKSSGLRFLGSIYVSESVVPRENDWVEVPDMTTGAQVLKVTWRYIEHHLSSYSVSSVDILVQ